MIYKIYASYLINLTSNLNSFWKNISTKVYFKAFERIYQMITDDFFQFMMFKKNQTFTI